jgi:hypothetical protein
VYKVSQILVTVYANFFENFSAYFMVRRISVAVDFQRRIHEGDVEGLALRPLLLLAV